MEPDEVKRLIETGIADGTVSVTGDGRHFEAVVISASFGDKNMLQRHRAIYAALGDRMQNDVVHALSIKAYTPEEWAQRQA